MRTKLILVLAILMGLTTTFLFYKYISQFDEEAGTMIRENRVEVVIANQTIKKNQRITAEHLSMAVLPSEGLHPQVLKETSELIGGYALSDILQGEPILSHRIGDAKDESLFVSRKVKEGHRAVSVGVNFVQTVSNLIEPEDRVDVIFSEQPPDADVIESELLLENVRVLAVGRRLIESLHGQDFVEYSSVTLELRSAEAVTIVNASQRGSLQMILHSRIHAGEGNTDVHTSGF